MNLIRHVHKINAVSKPIPEGNYLSGRIGFWGIVISQNSKNNTVTVVSDTGFEFKNIPVVSTEWVTVDENKNYIPSTRNLPPRNSRVFVLTPTFSANGAFVLCSGFSRGDENIRALWAKNDDELEIKNNSRETKTQGGWDIKEEYENGNFSASSNDNSITFIANSVKDDDKSEAKEVSVKAWNTKITITESGLNISVPSDANLTLNVQGDCSVSVNGDVDVTGTNVTLNGDVKVTGGSFTAGGTVTPNGSGALCGIAVCPFTGAPQTGSISNNT